MCKQIADVVMHARAKEQDILIVSTVQQACGFLETDEPMYRSFFVMHAVVAPPMHVWKPLFHIVVKQVMATWIFMRRNQNNNGLSSGDVTSKYSELMSPLAMMHLEAHNEYVQQSRLGT